MTNNSIEYMSPSTITTDAVGRSEGLPGSATIEALAVGDGQSAYEAKAVAKDQASTIRESVADGSTHAVRTVNFQVLESDKMFEPDTESPFQATERLEIECVPEHAESVVVDVTSAGGTVQNVKFYLHENRLQKLQDEALSIATERARKKAERIAAAEDLTVAEVQELTTKQVNRDMKSIVDDALASPPDTDVHPSPIVISERVEVVYKVTGGET